jgi:hypothetical protein
MNLVSRQALLERAALLSTIMKNSDAKSDASIMVKKKEKDSKKKDEILGKSIIGIKEQDLQQRRPVRRLGTRLPDGRIVISEFQKNDTLKTLKEWILKESRVTDKKLKLFTSFPKRVLDLKDETKSLEELDIFGTTLYAQWEEKDPGFIYLMYSRIFEILSLIIFWIKSKFNQDTESERERPPTRTYNGNSTNLE